MTGTQGYLAVSRRALDLEDYIDVARRHAAWIAGPVFGGVVISICIAFCLKNSYESSAMLQISPPQISENLVQQTENQPLVERLQQMQAVIESRGVLSNIIQDPRLDLYKEDRAKYPIDDVIEEMRRDIHIGMGNEAVQFDRHGAATFTIRFTYNQRLKTQATVNTLITKFMEENENQEHRQQTVTKDFFGDQFTEKKAALERSSEELTKFRADHQGELPENLPTNMANLTSLTTQANAMNDELNRLEMDKQNLDTHLSTLKNQMSLAETMAADDPAAPLPLPTLRQNEELAGLNREITASETQLQIFLQSYKETYPDIKALRARLAVITKRRDAILAQQEKEKAAEAAKPKEAVKKRPNYQMEAAQQSLQGQIDQTNTALANNGLQRKAKVAQQETLNKDIRRYQATLAVTSSIQAKYADLERAYTDATKEFEETSRKRELTLQNGSLTERKATETLNVLDPPSLPSKPSKPNRWLIVGGGFAISLVLGLALAGVQEARDTSLKNLKDVRAYTNLPVLSSIPLLENTLLVKRKRRITYLLWSAAVITGIIAICASLFYYTTVIYNQ